MLTHHEEPAQQLTASAEGVNSHTSLPVPGPYVSLVFLAKTWCLGTVLETLSNKTEKNF
jgi:hypothetical protein